MSTPSTTMTVYRTEQNSINQCLDSLPFQSTQHRLKNQAPMTDKTINMIVLSKIPAYQATSALWQVLELKPVYLNKAQEVLIHVAHQTTGFILLDPEFGKQRFMDNIKRIQPRIRFIFIITDPLPLNLIKLNIRGHIFSCLPSNDTPSKLAQALLETIFPRTEQRHLFKNMIISFETRVHGKQQRWKRKLIDISTHGIAWQVHEHDACAALTPGTTLHNLHIFKDGDLVLSEQAALIKHLNAYPTKSQTSPGYKAGAQFLKIENTSNRQREEKVFRDPIIVAALLKQALERAELKFTEAYHPSVIYPGTWSNNQEFTDKFLFFTSEWPEAWVEGIVIRCVFELNNWGCEFLSVIEQRINRHVIRLQSPVMLKGMKRRETPRQQLANTSRLLVRFMLPFSTKLIDVLPKNMSSSGFCFELKQTIGPIPVGTFFKSLFIRGIKAGDKKKLIHCAGIVRFVTSIHRHGKRYYRCGVEFKKLSNQQHLTLVDTLMAEKYQNIKSGQGMTLDELWSFFYASNFIYPEKEEAMRPILDKVKKNVSKLIQNRDSSILRTIVVKPTEVPMEAHQALLHAYTQTWIMQHLSSIGVKKGKTTAIRDLNPCTLNTLGQIKTARWLRTYIQPKKNSPDKLVGVFARRIEDNTLSVLNVYAYLTSPCNYRRDSNHLFSVRIATAKDFPIIEKYFIYQDNHIEFLAEDGIFTEMELQSMQREYQPYGLTRRRQIVVAEHHGRICGIALLEFSAFGLNLSEITNRCTIHVWDKEPFALKTLAEYARDQYRRLAYPFCIIMVKPKYAPWLTTSGFAYCRDYACWTLHHSLFPEYANYLEKLFDRRA